MAEARKGRILVTGASTGIGYACAIRFGRIGYTVFAGVRKPADCKALQAENITPILLDITSPQSISGALAALGSEPLAGLVNNAGIAVTGPLELVPVEAWRNQFEVNVIGMVAVTQAFLPLLRQGKGRIVNVGSVAGRSALPGSAPYDSSKFAIEAITDALRMELQSSGISVSLIEPGAVATPLWQKTLVDTESLRRQSAPDLYKQYAGLMTTIQHEASVAARKAVSADTVAKAVEHAITARHPKTRYLVGPDARFWLLLNLLPDRWRDRLILSRLQK